MDSIIDVQRQTHEEIERFERALYTLLSRNTSTHEGKVQNEHRAAQVLDRISSRVVALNNLYDDKNAREQEINSLSTPPNQQNNLEEFYSRLSKIREHHSKYPDSVTGGFELELASLLEEPSQDDDDYEDEDRTLDNCSLVTITLNVLLKLFLYYFLEKRSMESILTFTQTTPHTII